MKTYEKNTDEELVNAILQNDSNALGELYSRYYKKVFQKCLSIVKNHDEAFDLAQEALMKCFDSLKSFRRESSFSTWLYIITHRYCLGALRKRNQMLVKNVLIDCDTDGSHESNLLNEEASDRNDLENIMRCLIENLPENERQLLLLKYEKGESIEALTSLLHVSSSAIKMRLKRSKEKLNHLYILATTFGLSEALSQLQ